MAVAHRLPTAMSAAFVTRPGPEAPIRIGRRPVPAPGAGEVVVRFAASTVNHVDLLVRSGSYTTPVPTPFVVGRDIVGTVVAVGAAVTALHIGETVWCNSMGHAGRNGTLADYVALPVDRVYRLPDGVDAHVAAPALHAVATAHLGLLREGRLGERAHAGATVVIGHASGAVGSAAVRVAAMYGASVIASAQDDDHDWVRECGATEVIAHDDLERSHRIRRSAPDGVDLWWDTSGRHDLAAALPSLRRGGRLLITAGLAAGAAHTIAPGPLYTEDRSIHGFAISNASVADLAAAAVTTNHLLATGVAPVRVGAVFRLRETAAAYAAMAAGSVRGRILLVP